VVFEYATNLDGPTIVLKKDEALKVLEQEEISLLSSVQVPGFQTVAVLEPFTAEEVGPNLLPSDTYGSDHIAIAADLQLFW
jgi:hypothetical protein